MSKQIYVALLRGINVGGNKKVSMAELKKVFEKLGYEDVRTYINSGNVIFTSSKKSFSSIEKALKKAFGFDVAVIVRDAKSIQKLNKAIPATWKNDSKQRTDVLFLWDAYDNKKSLKLFTVKPKIDNLKYVSGAIIWNFDRKNYNKSGMGKMIGTLVYKNLTARNVNTVRKLAAMMSEK